MKAIKYTNSGIFNIGVGKSVTLISLIKKIERLSGKIIPCEIKEYRDFEVKDFHINVNKARRKLGFNTSINIEDGLQRFVNIYK